VRENKMRRPDLWIRAKFVICLEEHEKQKARRKERKKVLPPLKRTPDKGVVQSDDGIIWFN